nr:phospholipase-like protein [Tanacetum cinerariifolium]
MIDLSDYENFVDYNDEKEPIPFKRRVFCSSLDGQPISGKNIETLINSDAFKTLDDNDAVILCCVGILQLVLLGLEDRRLVSNWILRLANDRDGWDNYPWGSHVWPTLYQQLKDAKVRRWPALYATRPKDEVDKKSYSITGFAWAFKEDRGQLAIMNLDHQYGDAIEAKDELLKAYEQCRDISIDKRAMIEKFLKNKSELDYEMQSALFRKKTKLKKQSRDNLTGINGDCQKFNSIYKHLTRNSGENEADHIENVKGTYMERYVKGLSKCKASESNIRRIQVKDIVKEVEDYLKTYSSASSAWLLSEELAGNSISNQGRTKGDLS